MPINAGRSPLKSTILCTSPGVAPNAMRMALELGERLGHGRIEKTCRAPELCRPK